MLAACLITSTASQSQTTTEEQLKTALAKSIRLLQVCDIDKEKNALLQQQVVLLKQQLAIKDSMVKAYVAKDTIATKITDTYKNEIAILQQQLQLAQAELKKQNKFYRRQKRKTVFVAIAGPVVTAATILYLKK